jgi:hypothetical protein
MGLRKSLFSVREAFVADSPLEADEFELLVPPRRNSWFGRAIRYRARLHQLLRRWGTKALRGGAKHPFGR